MKLQKRNDKPKQKILKLTVPAGLSVYIDDNFHYSVVL